MKRVLIVLAAIALLAAVVHARTAGGDSTTGSIVVEPPICVDRAVIDDPFDGSDLFVATPAIPACLDLGVACVGDRGCQGTCGTFGGACQCNQPSGLDCGGAGNCTCQICF